MTKVVEPLPLGWAFNQWSPRVDALGVLPHRVRVLLSAEWSRSVLHLFKEKYPKDLRPLKAIEAAEVWAYDPTEANRAAASAADAAASAAASAADAANAAYAAAAGAAKWGWLYATYCHARGPLDLEFKPEWRTETAVSLAKQIVSERSFDLMPILADALQDAGCDNRELMTHLQQDVDEWTSADWALWNLLDLNQPCE